MKKSITTLLMLAALAVSINAQTGRTFVLQNSADGVSELHCSLPQHPTGRAIVCCPGGAYGFLSLEKEGTDWAQWFNERGIAYFTLKYRLPEGNPELPVADACHAMQTVRDSADVWDINRYDVGIMGFSAGGHLAATISTQAPFSARPDFTILFYPVITMNQRWSHANSVKNFLGDTRTDEQVVKRYSAEEQVDHYATPPALLLLSNDDPTVPPVTNAVAYYSAMRKTGNDCAMNIYPTGGHGYGFNSRFKYHDQMLADLERWLDEHKEPSQDAIRVACIGNSITRGSCIDMASQRGYPAQLQKLLGQNYHVRNFGMPGYTMLRKGNMPYLKTQCWQMAQDFQPQVVIIKLGTNDSKPYNWQYGHEFAADLQSMIDTLSSLPSKPKIYLATPIPAFRDNLNIVEQNICEGIIPAIQEVAKHNKLEVIDLHSLFTDEKFIGPDYIHPNAEGAAEMARIISEHIKK